MADSWATLNKLCIPFTHCVNPLPTVYTLYSLCIQMLSEAQAMTVCVQEETADLEGVTMIAPTIIRKRIGVKGRGFPDSVR